MDPLTHSLAGLAIARVHGGGELSRRATVLTALAAANAPDIEALLWPLSPDLYARFASTLTHSAGALLLAPFVLGFPLAKLAKVPLKPVAWLIFWCVLSHLALDAFTPRGILIGYPAPETWLALPWLYWAEPLLWVVLAAMWWLAPLWRASDGRKRAIAALVACGAYIGMAGILTEVARTHALGIAEARGLPVSEVEVFPAPLWPTQRSVFLVDESWVSHVWYDALSPPEAPLARWTHNRSDPAVAFLLSQRPGKVFRWWAVAPIARVGEVYRGGRQVTVELRDLRWHLPSGPLPAPSMVATIAFKANRHTLVDWRWVTPTEAPELKGLTTPAVDPPPREGPRPTRANPSKPKP